MFVDATRLCSRTKFAWETRLQVHSHIRSVVYVSSLAPPYSYIYDRGRLSGPACRPVVSDLGFASETRLGSARSISVKPRASARRVHERADGSPADDEHVPEYGRNDGRALASVAIYQIEDADGKRETRQRDDGIN